MGIFDSPCPFPYGDSPYGNGEPIFGDLQVTHRGVSTPQILDRKSKFSRSLVIVILSKRCAFPLFAPSHSSLSLHRSRLGIALIPAHWCFHLGIISLTARWSLLAPSHLHESLLKQNSPRGGFSHSYNRRIHP
jgi:hypothetical protein